jgi:hypothetical protein
VRQVCRGCDAQETNYAEGRCARCVLRERVGELTRGGDPVAVTALQGYLDALLENPKPTTVLRWMGKSRGMQTLRELTGGALPLTHDALDEVDRGQSTIFLRAALVHHGALPECNHDKSAALAVFINRVALRVPTVLTGSRRARSPSGRSSTSLPAQSAMGAPSAPPSTTRAR